MLIVSGALLALGGPSWYHTTTAGNSSTTHFWSVQVFFAGAPVAPGHQVLPGACVTDAG